MKKSVFVIETPERCGDCPCIGISAGCHVGYCKLAGKINSDYHVKIIPDWCPLRPLPEKLKQRKEVTYWNGVIDGWNDCIDEITGENDDE